MTRAWGATAVQSEAGSFSVPPDHPCLPGHFPDQPIVPGALLLDHALGLLAGGGFAPDQPARLSVRFLAAVMPGDTVAIRCAPSRLGGIAFEGHVGPRRVLNGRIEGMP